MKTRNVENRLALLGALIVLFGVAFAARSALGDELPTIGTTAAAIHTAADTSVLQADEAQRHAVHGSALGVAAESRQDLDSRLPAPISIAIARH